MSWHLSVQTAPTFEPVSLDLIRQHCRIDDSYDDAYLTRILDVAVAAIEKDTSHVLATTTFNQYIDHWPGVDFIELKRVPINSVTHVKWKDTAGTQTALTVTTEYLAELGSGDPAWPGRIVLPYSKNWPTGTLYPSDPIEIRFVAGYAADAAKPDPLVQAVLIMCGHLYENREEVVVTDSQTFAAEVPRTVKRLIAPYKLKVIG